jgi:protein-disulfide isomerase
MKIKLILALSALLVASSGLAQSAPPAQSARPAPPPAARASAPPLQLNSIAPPKRIQFPAADPKNFTAPSPTTAEVNAFLKELWGYDPNRVWQVDGIQTTNAPSTSKVTVAVAEQGVSHGPATTVFFVTPDGHHAIAGNEVIAFGAHPFRGIGLKLEQRATGPSRGATSNDLLLVEFADLECPHCAEAAKTMDQLATDFPNAKIVFENFPLSNVHAAAEKAAEYGVCVAQQKGNAAFFQYVQAVYGTQGGLLTKADETLKAAATKAGADAAQVSSCASGAAAKAAVASSVKLGQEVGVDQTPFLFVNGRPIPISGIPYNSLRQIIAYAATEGAPQPARK